MPSSSIDDLAGRLLTLCSLGVFPNAAFPGEGPTTRWKWPGFAYWLPARVLWTCQRAVMIRYLHAWPSQRNFLWSLLGDLLGMNSERVVSSYYPHHIALAERLYDLGVPGVWGTQKPWGLYTRSLEHLISILPSLEWDELESKAPDLLNILRDLDDDFDPCRAKALVALSRTQAVRAGNILIDMLAIATQIGPWQFRAFALSALVPYLVELPNEEASPALSEGLRSLARRGRESFIADLRFLVPWIRKLGGTSVIEEAAQALQDVGCWWP